MTNRSQPRGIMICIGGAQAVGREAHKLIDAQVASAGNVEAAREHAGQIHIVFVDTDPDAVDGHAEPGKTLILPHEPGYVNERILELYREGGDSFFRLSWPTINGKPFLPGNIYFGCGGNRQKAKGVWRLALAEQNGNIATLVGDLVKQINNALGPAAYQHGLNEIPVFLVFSVSGGTGSGMGLALAQQLRAALPQQCALVGVVLLPTVTESLVSTNERGRIWINSAYALAEIDYFQLPAALRPQSLVPYFKWPGASGTIEGADPPFRYCMLFDASNRDGKSLPDYDSYLRLVAECLVTELFSPVRQNINTPGSQFRQLFDTQPIHDGRAWTYASASVADLRLPVERIERHLGRVFAGRVMRDWLVPADAEQQQAYQQGGAVTAQFLDEHRLRWSTNQLAAALELPAPGEPPLPAAPELSLDDPDFDNAKRDNSLQYVLAQKDTFDRWLGEEFEPLIRRHRDDVVTEQRGTLGQLTADSPFIVLLETRLQTGGGQGYLQARGAVDRLVAKLQAEQDAVNEELLGPRWRETKGEDGLEAQTKAHRAALADEFLPALERGFGLLSPHGKSAKESFINQWWQPYVTGERRLRVAQMANAVYTELLKDAKNLQANIRLMTIQLREMTNELASAAQSDLGARYQGGVLESGVLDEPWLVEAHFASDLAAVASDKRAIAFVDRLIVAKDGGLLALFRALWTAGNITLSDDQRRGARSALKSLAVTDGAALFADTVRGLSVWDALEIECNLRQRLNRIDIPLQQALAVRDERQDALDQAGLADSNATAHLLQRYIEARLSVCQTRAQPFWSLDPVMIASNHGPDDDDRPYHMTVFAYDADAYEAFRKRTDIDDFMVGITAKLGVSPSDRPGKYAVTAYEREGGVPLFYLNRDTRHRLRESARRRERHLFTDQRFAGVIDCEFEPPESADARARYTVAAAAHFGLLNLATGGVTLAINGHGPVEFPSVADLHHDLLADNGSVANLAQQIDACFAALPEESRAASLAAISQTTRKQAATAASPIDRVWWEATAPIVAGRERDGRYRIGH